MSNDRKLDSVEKPTGAASETAQGLGQAVAERNTTQGGEDLRRALEPALKTAEAALNTLFSSAEQLLFSGKTPAGAEKPDTRKEQAKNIEHTMFDLARQVFTGTKMAAEKLEKGHHENADGSSYDVSPVGDNKQLQITSFTLAKDKNDPSAAPKTYSDIKYDSSGLVTSMKEPDGSTIKPKISSFTGGLLDGTYADGLERIKPDGTRENVGFTYAAVTSKGLATWHSSGSIKFDGLDGTKADMSISGHQYFRTTVSKDGVRQTLTSDWVRGKEDGEPDKFESKDYKSTPTDAQGIKNQAVQDAVANFYGNLGAPSQVAGEIAKALNQSGLKPSQVSEIFKSQKQFGYAPVELNGNNEVNIYDREHTQHTFTYDPENGSYKFSGRTKLDYAGYKEPERLAHPEFRGGEAEAREREQLIAGAKKLVSEAINDPSKSTEAIKAVEHALKGQVTVVELMDAFNNPKGADIKIPVKDTAQFGSHYLEFGDKAQLSCEGSRQDDWNLHEEKLRRK